MFRTSLYLLVFISALLSCTQVTEPLTAPTQIPTSVPTSPTIAPVLKITPVATPSASSIVLKLQVSDPDLDVPKYDREEWRHWTDEDGDCQDARQETLIAESTIEVTYTDSDQCRVESGHWIGPYTGTVVTDPSDLDIDHMVPLANAHKSGGWEWSKDRKSAYANSLAYPGHLIATTAHANRSKGAKGPDEWRPPSNDYWCQYALDWIEIKRAWNLTATEDEIAALREMVQTCETNVFVQPADTERQPEPTAQTIERSPSPTPTTRPSEPSQTFEDRNCSDFDSWSEAQKFFEASGGPDEDPHGLDRDRDGVACGSLPGAPVESTATPITFTPTHTAVPSTPTSTVTPIAPTPTEVPPTPIPTVTPPAPTPTQTSGSQPVLKYDPNGPDRNCSDFDSWSEAQAFFLAAGGPNEDPHRLDRNSDGVSCESLPGAP